MRTKSLLALLAVLGLAFLPQAHATVAFHFFEITGSGSLYHFEGGPTPGTKPAVTKISSTAIVNCINGTTGDCQGGVVETDSGGKAYLFIVSNTQVVLATNDSCSGTVTVLNGLTGGDGSFMFTGHHDASDTDVVVQGKATLTKGTLTPAFIKNASVLAVSTTHEHYAIGTFDTVGAVQTMLGNCPPL